MKPRKAAGHMVWKVLILYISHPEKWIYCDKRWAEIVSTLAQNHNYNKVEGIGEFEGWKGL